MNTNISLHSVHRQLICEFWVFRISISLRRLDRSSCRPPQATGLGFACALIGGIDLLERLEMVGELNST